MMMLIELRCSREIALWLGAVSPTTVNHHRELKGRGCMLVRDRVGWPMFWDWELTREERASEAKS